MKFYIKNRIVTTDEPTKQLDSVSENKDYIAEFFFDDEWAGKTKTARFVHNFQFADVLLDDYDRCVIPVKILKSGILEVGVYTETMTTTGGKVNILPSIKNNTGYQPDPTHDVYEQILGKLDRLVKIDDATLEKSISDYLKANPASLAGYAYGIRETASGKIVTVTDSANATIQKLKVTPTDESVTSVKVTSCGKNIIDITTLYPRSGTQGGKVTFDGDVANVSSNNQNWALLFSEYMYLPAGAYNLSFVVSNYNATTPTMVYFRNDTKNTSEAITFSSNGSYNKDLTLAELCKCRIYVSSNESAQIVSNTFTVSKLQLIHGINQSYERYKGQTVTINTTTQTGWETLETFYPVTNILTDVDANIECTYIADTKNYIDNKLTK